MSKLPFKLIIFRTLETIIRKTIHPSENVERDKKKRHKNFLTISNSLNYHDLYLLRLHCFFHHTYDSP